MVVAGAVAAVAAADEGDNDYEMMKNDGGTIGGKIVIELFEDVAAYACCVSPSVGRAINFNCPSIILN